MRVSFDGELLEVNAVLADAEAVEWLIRILEVNKVLLPADANLKHPRLDVLSPERK